MSVLHLPIQCTWPSKFIFFEV